MIELDAIARMVGMPYAEPGSDGHRAGIGHDCWSCAAEAVRLLTGVRLPANPVLCLQPDPWARLLPPGAPLRSSDVLHGMLLGSHAAHVAVVIDTMGGVPRCVHAVRGTGVCVWDLNRLRRASARLACYRLRTPEQGGTA